MSEDFWNVKPPDMEGTKGRPPRTGATTSGTAAAADDPNSPPPPPLADDVCKLSNPSPFLNSWYGSPLNPRKTSISSFSLSLSLSLSRVSYTIPGLFCNTKSLTASQMLSRKRNLQSSSFGKQRRFPASCSSSSSQARSKSTKQSRRRRRRRRRRKATKTKKTQQKQNKTKQNKCRKKKCSASSDLVWK
jgi:hypothetical protein